MLTSGQVRTRLFASTQFRPGYDQRQVDDFLGEAAAELQKQESQASARAAEDMSAGVSEVMSAELSPGRSADVSSADMGETCSIGPAAGAASTSTSRSATGTHAPTSASLSLSASLSANDVENRRFRQTSFRAGYNQTEVDDFLSDVQKTLLHYESKTAQ